MTKKWDPITESEVVLVFVDNKPGFFARVEQIVADVKPGWWRVKLLVLTWPLTVVNWIIDNEQICGADFTMGGIPVRIEKVKLPTKKEVSESTSQKSEPQQISKPVEPDDKQPEKQARILSLESKRKRK